MKIIEVLAHTSDDDNHFNQMLKSLWARHSSPKWQQAWPFQTITQTGSATVVGAWPPQLHSIYFFLDPDGQPIGFLNLHKGGREGNYENNPHYAVTMIWIAPQWRQQGIARAFYNFLQQQIPLMPDTKQSAGGVSLWKNRNPVQL